MAIDSAYQKHFRTPVAQSLFGTTLSKPGFYRHFKGHVYVVLGTVLDTETSEHRVLYRNLEGQHFSRNTEEFSQSVVLDGQEVLRFTPMLRDEILAIFQA